MGVGIERHGCWGWDKFLHRCTASSGVFGDIARKPRVGGAFQASDDRFGNVQRVWLAAGRIRIDPSPDDRNGSNSEYVTTRTKTTV